MCSKQSEMRDMRLRYWPRHTRKSSFSGSSSLSDFYLKSEYINECAASDTDFEFCWESLRSSQKSHSGVSPNTSVLRCSQSRGISRACEGSGLIFVNPQAEVVRMRVGMREKRAAGEGMHYKWQRFRESFINWECSSSLRNTCDNRERSSRQWNAKLPLWFLGDVILSQKERERGVENKGNRGRGGPSAEMNFSKEKERRRRSSAWVAVSWLFTSSWKTSKALESVQEVRKKRVCGTVKIALLWQVRLI